MAYARTVKEYAMSDFNTQNRTLDAINALKSGAPVNEAETSDLSSGEEDVSIEEPTFSMDADYGEERDSEATESDEEETEELDASADDADDSEDETEVDDSEGDEQSADIEYIKADGKKIKVDYTDRERIKKVHQMAAGMRKFQSERDSAIKERDELKPKYDELKGLFDKADNFIENQDDDGLFHLITGGKELEKIVEARVAERDEMSKLSPQELEAYTNKRVQDKRLAEIERKEKALAKREEEADAKLDTSEKTRQQTMVETVFNEYRFAGQFGDDEKSLARENEADTMLWNAIDSDLQGYDKVDLELIRKVVKTKSDSLRSLIDVQANKKVNSQIKKKKNTAKKEVQKAVFDKDATKKKELQSQIKNRDYTGSLQNLLSGGFDFLNN